MWTDRFFSPHQLKKRKTFHIYENVIDFCLNALIFRSWNAGKLYTLKISVTDVCEIKREKTPPNMWLCVCVWWNSFHSLKHGISFSLGDFFFLLWRREVATFLQSWHHEMIFLHNKHFIVILYTVKPKRDANEDKDTWSICTWPEWVLMAIVRVLFCCCSHFVCIQSLFNFIVVRSGLSHPMNQKKVLNTLTRTK